MTKVEFPRRHAAWRVLWCDFRGHHNWIGRAPVPSGGVHKRGRPIKKPPVQHRDFFKRAAADEFAQKLRGRIPVDELVVQVVALPQRCLSPQDEMLPGPWPQQQRDSE